MQFFDDSGVVAGDDSWAVFMDKSLDNSEEFLVKRRSGFVRKFALSIGRTVPAPLCRSASRDNQILLAGIFDALQRREHVAVLSLIKRTYLTCVPFFRDPIPLKFK